MLVGAVERWLEACREGRRLRETGVKVVQRLKGSAMAGAWAGWCRYVFVFFRFPYPYIIILYVQDKISRHL